LHIHTVICYDTLVFYAFMACMTSINIKGRRRLVLDAPKVTSIAYRLWQRMRMT
jgi:hypothetical protein